MRTVDPEVWSRALRKPALGLARPPRFGRRAHRAAPSRLRASLRRVLQEYFAHCSVPGVRLVANPENTACARYSYAALLVALLCWGLYEEALVARGGGEHSTVRARAARPALRDAPFPAVALCPNNVVSKAALHTYASSIGGRGNHTYGAEHAARTLAQLGHVLALSAPADRVDSNFMGYLASVDPRASVSRLMLMFAPRCGALLVRCRWRGREQPCRDLFSLRPTPLGYCCVFNDRYRLEDIFKLPRFLDLTGEENGLSVVVKQDLDDFAFFRRQTYDIDVLLFDGSDYPLLEGGGARMFPAELDAAVYLALKTSVHYPEEGLQHDIDTPRCRSRQPWGAVWRRSRAWCLTECRARVLAELCACRLHTMPADPHDQRQECSLTDLECLSQHQEKFLYYAQPGAAQVEPAHACPACVADCARYAYSARVSAPRHVMHARLPDPLLAGLSSENATTIRLFYSEGHLDSYEYEANYRWYESFVKVGSEWALIVGAAVLSGAELVFHCTVRWRRQHSPAAGRLSPLGAPGAFT